MENPFVIGKVVRGKHFCNREKEIQQIRELLKSRQHIVIISPRRYGKTSLILHALERSKIPFLYVDCSFIGDEKSLAGALLNAYAQKLDSIALLEKFVRRFDITLSVTLHPLQISVREVKSTSLAALLAEISRNYTTVFDEFQDIYEKDPTLVRKLRSTVQFLDHSVVMLGSRRHLLHHLFLTPRGIFYNFGQALHLQKIDRAAFTRFIRYWFEKNKLAIKDGETERLLGITECHPFFTQYLSHFLFEKRQIGPVGVEAVLEEILRTNSAFYEETYRSVAPSQQKALLLLSSGQKGVYSATRLRQFGIASSQALQKALGALVKKEIVDKNGHYYILDVFFRHWLYQLVLNQKV